MAADSSEIAPGFHQPVMVEEVLATLEGAREGLILDGTLGGGGHAKAMLARWPKCRVVGVDRDREAIREAKRTLQTFEDRVRYLHMRFDLAPADTQIQRERLEGALLDLGVSSWQLEAEHRGFAFRRGSPLDMRMEPGEGPTAAELLGQLSEEELARVFREYGEEPRARRVAKQVVRRREQRPFRTSDDLVAALDRALQRPSTPRDKARVFQALRIAVNEELDALRAALPAIRDVLNASGVLVVISYHSIEDRIVKDAFREWSMKCVCPPRLPVCTCRGKALGEPVGKGPQRPAGEEVLRNPRARSARLRAWRKAA